MYTKWLAQTTIVSALCLKGVLAVPVIEDQRNGIAIAMKARQVAAASSSVPGTGTINTVAAAVMPLPSSPVSTVDPNPILNMAVRKDGLPPFCSGVASLSAAGNLPTPVVNNFAVANTAGGVLSATDAGPSPSAAIAKERRDPFGGFHGGFDGDSWHGSMMIKDPAMLAKICGMISSHIKAVSNGSPIPIPVSNVVSDSGTQPTFAPIPQGQSSYPSVPLVGSPTPVVPVNQIPVSSVASSGAAAATNTAAAPTAAATTVAASATA